MRSVGAQVIDRCGILAGLGIVENGYDETAKIAAVAPAELEQREKELLVQAKRWMPRLPFRDVDLLIIDEFGKNISGSGMDTNVVGRKRTLSAGAHEYYPTIKRIMVRDLTPETHGNAAGIGVAEFCSKAVMEKIDLNATRINCLTGGSPDSAKLPISFDTERQIVDAALATIVWPSRRKRGCCGSAAPCTSAKSSARRCSSTRRRDATIWRSSPTRARSGSTVTIT